MTAQTIPDLVIRTAPTSFGTLSFLTPAERTSDEALLLLHGFGSSSAVWTPLVAAARAQNILAGRDIVAVDLPGFGASENRLGHLQQDILGRVLLDLVHALGYSRVRVVGHSMGGFLTLDMAVRYPDEIMSIHIISGSYFTVLNMVNRPAATFARHPLIGIFYYMQLLLSYHDRLSGVINRALARRPAARSGHKAHFLLGGPAFRYGAANGIGYDALKLWGSIRIPVYGAFGANDHLVTPADMRQLQAVLPAAKLTLIPRTGHSSLLEKPDSVAQALFGNSELLTKQEKVV